MIPMEHFLILGAILVCIGFLGVVIRKSAIGMLISLEILFNGISLTAVTFNRYLYPEGLEGQILVIFIITLAAAETAVALAIMLNVARKFKTIDLDQMSLMRG